MAKTSEAGASVSEMGVDNHELNMVAWGCHDLTCQARVATRQGFEEKAPQYKLIWGWSSNGLTKNYNFHNLSKGGEVSSVVALPYGARKIMGSIPRFCRQPLNVSHLYPKCYSYTFVVSL